MMALLLMDCQLASLLVESELASWSARMMALLLMDCQLASLLVESELASLSARKRLMDYQLA